MSEAKRRISYRPDIDAMRGIAVLAVFIYHLNEAWLPGGFAGVDIFFVISGYVVTGSIIGHSTETPWQQLSGFYLRRIRRILPNLLASVGVTSLGIALLVPPTETRSLFGDAVKALYGWSNNRFAAKATDYFGLDSNLNPLSHTWSLGVEEQFYLIFPLLLLLIGVSRKRALPILLGLSLASLGLSLWWTQEAPILAFFLMPSRFWELSAGSVLLLAQLRGFGGHLNRLWLRLGGYGLMLLAVLKTSAQQWFPAPGALVAVLATLLLLQAGYGATSQRFLPWRWLERALVACGLLSYSLYLWHWPVLVFLRWTWGIDRAWLYLVAIGLSFGLAWLAYVLIEQPVRRRPLSAPFQWGLSLAAMAVTWTGIDALAHPYRGKFFLGSGVDPVPKLEKIIGGPHKLMNSLNECQVNPNQANLLEKNLPPVARCRINNKKNIEYFLWGDSHAFHMLPMLNEVVIASDSGLSFSFMQACLIAPNLTITYIQSGKDHSACTRYSLLELKRAERRLKFGDILIISNWQYWELLGISEAATGVGGGNPVNTIKRSGKTLLWPQIKDQYVKDLLLIANTLRPKGVNVIVIADTPWLRDTIIKCESWSKLRPDKFGHTYCSPDAKVMTNSRIKLMSILREAEKKASNLHVFDPAPNFISNGKVRHKSPKGDILYSDQHHLSYSGSKDLAAPFQRFLEAQGLVAANPR